MQVLQTHFLLAIPQINIGVEPILTAQDLYPDRCFVRVQLIVFQVIKTEYGDPLQVPLLKGF